MLIETVFYARFEWFKFLVYEVYCSWYTGIEEYRLYLQSTIPHFGVL